MILAPLHLGSWLRAAAAMLVAVLVAAVEVAQAAEHFDLYFLSVGSTFYATPAAPDQQAFARLRGANKSARVVAQHFQRAGARFGVLLASNERQLLSLRDIESALDRVKAAIRTNKPPSPFILFYFAGHGISEGVGWNHFSMPGTFLYRGKLSAIDPEALSKRTLHAAALADKLDRLKVPYMIILDTCYEGDLANFQSPILTGPAIESLRNVAAILRFTNEFHQNNPVLFSTAPGTVVPTAPDPVAPQSDPVAPLARRMMIVFDAASKDGGDLSLAQFVRRMTSPDLDRETKPAVTHAEPAAQWNRSLFFPAAVPAGFETRSGTAAAGEVCCGTSGMR